MDYATVHSNAWWRRSAPGPITIDVNPLGASSDAQVINVNWMALAICSPFTRTA
jgi:hypothetical protein